MATHESDKKKFDSDIAKMKASLLEDDGDVILKGDTTKEKKDNNTTAQQGDFSNHIVVLKMRLSKIIATNKEKKRLMNQYLQNVRVIEDAFSQITEVTGITSKDEIVTSFIKAEEQNYSLFNYVNLLGTETDHLEELNREIKEQIERIELRNGLTEQ